MDYKGAERETIINFNELEEQASVYTCSKRLINQLNKLAQERKECIKKRGDNETFIEFLVPKKWVKIRPSSNRVMSDEQKAKISERLQNARQKKFLENEEKPIDNQQVV